MSQKIYQIDMFRNDEIQLKEEEFKKRTDKSLRGLFARYNEMEYVILEMHKKLEKLEESAYKSV